MKHLLFFLAMLFCGIPAFSQNDLDFAFKTTYLTVYTQQIDSVATAAAKKVAKAGAKVENIIERDTVHVREGGLRYITKTERSVTIYDPNNPKANSTYQIEFAGWIKGAPNSFLKYNLVDKEGKLFGVMTVDLYMQELYLSTPTRQILYTTRE